MHALLYEENGSEFDPTGTWYGTHVYRYCTWGEGDSSSARRPPPPLKSNMTSHIFRRMIMIMIMKGFDCNEFQ